MTNTNNTTKTQTTFCDLETASATASAYDDHAGKALNELPREILDELIENNSRLRDIISDDLYYLAEMNIREMLDYFRDVRGFDYSLGSWGYNYITVDDDRYPEFLSAYLEANEAQCFFGDDATALAKRLSEKAGFFYDCNHGYVDISEKNFDRLQEWMSDGIDQLTDKMLKYCSIAYDYAASDDGIKEQFFEIWLDSNGDDYLYDGDGKIYRDIYEREYI